ncbi:MAG: HNH endonuclease [Candidatus Woesearchaeota archaeon]
MCGKKAAKFSDAEFDHTRAYLKSGVTNLSNIKIVHRLCNRLKGNKSLSETRKLLGIKSKTKKR